MQLLCTHIFKICVDHLALLHCLNYHIEFHSITASQLIYCLLDDKWSYYQVLLFNKAPLSFLLPAKVKTGLPQLMTMCSLEGSTKMLSQTHDLTHSLASSTELYPESLCIGTDIPN
jgi:hypothetical protein